VTAGGGFGLNDVAGARVVVRGLGPRQVDGGIGAVARGAGRDGFVVLAVHSEGAALAGGVMLWSALQVQGAEYVHLFLHLLPPAPLEDKLQLGILDLPRQLVIFGGYSLELFQRRCARDAICRDRFIAVQSIA
jgi:hypothetical protein